MHDGHDHEPPDPDLAAALARAQWDVDNVELVTVGIDIGSSTSHLLFSQVHLRRRATSLSSRFVVVGRAELWRSPIVLTPYLADDTIDAAELERFLGACYREAGLRRGDVDSGAVLLTGVAIRRRNARAIAELFAGEAGKFVCASAGHHLECTLAAHGSGAAALSRERDEPLLHLDVGGGTSKLALLHRGEVLDTSAIAVGGRLVAFEGGVAVRVEDAALAVAERLGLELAPGAPVAEAVRTELVEALADALAEAATGEVRTELARSLLLTEPPAWPVAPRAVSISGGVAEYVYGRERGRFGDLAPELAAALSARLSLPLVEPPQGIRATVIGSSQFSVQVSGNTVSIGGEPRLPRHGVPVLRPALDLSGPVVAEEVADAVVAAARRSDALERHGEVALAFAWAGDPSHARLRALAEGVLQAGARGVEFGDGLVLLLDGDVARSLGRLLREELGVTRPVVCLDGLELREFEYVDIGTAIEPTGVVPVVIKSLLFAEDGEPTGRRGRLEAHA